MTTEKKISELARIQLAAQKNNLVAIEANQYSYNLGQAMHRRDEEAVKMWGEKLEDARGRLFTEEQIKDNILILENILK